MKEPDKLGFPQLPGISRPARHDVTTGETLYLNVFVLFGMKFYFSSLYCTPNNVNEIDGW